MKRILKARLRRRVIVTTKLRGAFRGLLVDHDTQALVLGSAEQIDPESDKQFIPADGEIVILMADVAYFQFL